MFNTGDTVQLKSGGPVMTVKATDGDGNYICQWFDPRSRLQHASFREAGLMAAVKPPPDQKAAGIAERIRRARERKT